MAYLDLAEVPVLRERLRLLTKSRWGPACFLESDHAMTDIEPLDKEIRTWFETKTGRSVTGPIRLLTLLRNWGYYFSPLNLYYLFKDEEGGLEGIVAEVSNTPWREKHRYLLPPANGACSADLQCNHEKDFHVSPFMDMNIRYHWHCTIPSDSVSVTIKSVQSQVHIFTADLKLSRRELSDQEIGRALLRIPWATASIVMKIYWQALKLWWKRCPFYPHPNKPLSPTSGNAK